MSAWRNFSRKYPARVFSLLFVLLCIALIPVSGPNPRARLALQAALCESLAHGKIDYTLNSSQNSRVPWTIDWARTPDGNYYSNKAPGPSFLALPVHCAFYWIGSLGTQGPEERIERHYHSLYVVELLLSLIFQVAPFIFLAFWLLRRSHVSETSWDALFFFLAWFTGSTAALYLNSWFGHALPAWLFVGGLLTYLDRRWFFFGLFLGGLVLSDYGAMAVVAPLVLLVLVDPALKMGEKAKAAATAAIGALAPFLLWAHYHLKSFGGLLTLPQHFQNPVFVDDASQAGQLGAVMRSTPSLSVMGELLWGTRRGLLLSQPWILFLIVFLVLSWTRLPERLRRASLFVGLSLAALLLMNASFGQWHGGGAAGPRYLSACLPAFALLLLWFFPQLARWQKQLLGVGLGLSLVLFSLVMSTTVAAPADPLWPTLWQIGMSRPGTLALRLGICALVFSFGIISWLRAISASKSSKE